MKLHCPHCGVKGTADDSYSGRKVKCPKCQGIFEVLQDMASEPIDDAPIAAIDSSPSISSESAVEEIENTTPTTIEEEEIGEPEEEESLSTTLDGAELELNPESDLVSSLEPQPDLETPVTTELEDSLAWDDIASEVDLDLTEEESGDEEPEDAFEESSAELQPLYDEPVAGDDDLSELPEVASEVHDELDEEILNLDEEDTTEIEDVFLEDSQLAEPIDSEEIEKELEEDFPEDDKIVELSEEDSHEDEIQPLREDEVELEPYGIDKEQCWQCGKEASDEETFIDKDGRLYCSECSPVETLKETDDLSKELTMLAEEMAALGGGQFTKESPFAQGETELGNATTPIATTKGLSTAFTIGGAVRKAWAKTKGAKGSIWAGSAVMYLVILVVVAGGAKLLPMMASDPTGLNGVLGNVLLQAINGALSGIFSAGLLLMGIRKVAGKDISWEMIFSGFSCAGKIVVASILQFILVSIGMMLLILPGIYLAIGYVMTIPLIIDKKMSPWQAMETSRKAIHKVWWKVLGLFIIMVMICVLSAIPLGIGVIWTWPMSIVLAGVVYRYLFDAGEKVDQ